MTSCRYDRIQVIRLSSHFAQSVQGVIPILFFICNEIFWVDKSKVPTVVSS